MINSANHYSISEIFNIESNVKYYIPKYQREYIWGKENWEELFDDIEESDGDHFIGSIICINKASDTFKQQVLELVDGQQRLTTIALLFCAIYDLLNKKPIDELEENKKKELISELMNLKYKLIQKQIKNDTKIDLSDQNNNFSDYKEILNEINVLEYVGHLKYKGVRIIYKAFKYYLYRLESYNIDELLRLLGIINKVMLVKIEVSTNSDAFNLFESLNNRGIPLSAIDLIKNKILSESDKQKKSLDTAFNKWKIILQNLEDYSTQERFLRHYYNAFKNNNKIKIENIPKALKSNIIKIYENLAERDLDFIFKELFTKSSIYSAILNNSSIEKEEIYSNLSDELSDLNHIKAAPSYMLLLFLFSLTPQIDISFYRNVINFLTKYFLRRNLTDFPSTRNLDQIFMELVEELSHNKKRITFDYILNFMTRKDRIASNQLFEEKLNGDIYEINVDVTRFVLSQIEKQKMFNKEKFVDFWERDNGKLIWTIEHILPEGRNLPQSWINMIAGDDKVEAKKIQNEFVHKLGNLTLTGYNSNLSNFDFEKKRDRTDPKGQFIGYKNGLFLNDDLKDKNIWNEIDIKNRTEKLKQIALEIFKIEF